MGEPYVLTRGTVTINGHLLDPAPEPVSVPGELRGVVLCDLADAVRLIVFLAVQAAERGEA